MATTRKTKSKAKPAAKKKAKSAPKKAARKKKKPKAIAVVTAPSGLTLVDEMQCGAEFLELVVDVDQLSVTVSGTVEEQELARFATFDELCAGYAAVWQQIVDEYGEPSNPFGPDDPAPMDVQAEWVRRERRANARATADDGVWEAKLAKARAVLAKFAGGKKALAAKPRMHDRIDLSGKALAESLQYVIEIDREDGEIPLGASKFGGCPHLPKELAWPEHEGEPMYFFAQLSLAEIAAVDPSGLVPARGILYAFITESATGRLLYTESTDLEVRKPSFERADYMDHLDDDEARLTFAPAFYFDQLIGDTGGPEAVAAALPATLRAEVAKILGCSPEPCSAFGGDRIFGGDPVDWQSMGSSYLKNPLFAQFDYSEGNFAIGVDPDDLRIGFFDDADSGYCGT